MKNKALNVIQNCVIPIYYKDEQKDNAIMIANELNLNPKFYQTFLGNYQEIILGDETREKSICLTSFFNGSFKTFFQKAFGKEYADFFLDLATHKSPVTFNQNLALLNKIYQYEYGNLSNFTYQTLKKEPFYATMMMVRFSSERIGRQNMYSYCGFLLYEECEKQNDYSKLYCYLYGKDYEKLPIIEDVFNRIKTQYRAKMFHQKMSDMQKKYKNRALSFSVIDDYIRRNNKNYPPISEETIETKTKVSTKQAISLILEFLNLIDSSGRMKQSFLTAYENNTLRIWNPNNQKALHDFTEKYPDIDPLVWKAKLSNDFVLVNCPFQHRMSELIKIVHEFIHFYEYSCSPKKEEKNETYLIFRELNAHFYEKLFLLYLLLKNYPNVALENSNFRFQKFVSSDYSYTLIRSCMKQYEKGKESFIPDSQIDKILTCLQDSDFFDVKTTYTISNILADNLVARFINGDNSILPKMLYLLETLHYWDNPNDIFKFLHEPLEPEKQNNFQSFLNQLKRTKE